MTAVEAFFATRSMQALEILAFGQLTASQIARELQVHPRTARRLLNRMVHDGWVVRRDGRKPTYSPTLRVVALAAQHAQRSSLVRHGTERIRGLQASTGGSVHLVVPCYRSTLRLARAGEDAAVTATRDVAPAHLSAAGKVLLAHRPGWRETVLGAPLAAMAHGTIVDVARLQGDLATVAERGYALEDEELRPGVRAISAPVRIAPGDEVVAALAISSARLPLTALRDFSAALTTSARELAESVAADGP